jgi:hypothetical protein
MAAKRVRLLVERAARLPLILIGACLGAVALGVGAVRERARRRSGWRARRRAAEEVPVQTVNKTSKSPAEPSAREVLPDERARAPGAPAEERLPSTEGEERAAIAKLDLGPAARAERPVEHIPWSYGHDRVTAAVIDPDRLYVYWEVTDEAIARARQGLGPAGEDAWLDLRVYDTSGLIFDGTNAHAYFDQRVERSDRQWFFQIGKPSSTAHVEIGAMSREGYFVRIARSGRVDFPRSEAPPWSEPEWMTVLPGTGEVQPAGPPYAAAAQPQRNGTPAPAPHGEEVPSFAPIPLWILREHLGEGAHVRRWVEGPWERFEWREADGTSWFELQRGVRWEGPLVATTWEAGPFRYPVEVEPPRRQEWQGRSFAYRVGDVTHVVYGPWQVVIRNLGAHQSRAVLSRWTVFRSWVASQGREVRTASAPGRSAATRPGASELALGASERLWLSGSELRLGGASEIWRMGASEVRFRGASETLYAGASEVRFRGASEVRFRGASERRLAGASERRLLGASERRLGGASERRLLGASERRLGGASERHLGGASEQLQHGWRGDEPAAPEPNPYPKVK